MSQQICWECQYACGGCSWSDSLRPIKGWRAHKILIGTQPTFTTYDIEYCPKFVQECRRASKASEQEVIAYGSVSRVQGKKIISACPLCGSEHKLGYTLGEIPREVYVCRRTKTKFKLDLDDIVQAIEEYINTRREVRR